MSVNYQPELMVLDKDFFPITSVESMYRKIHNNEILIS